MWENLFRATWNTNVHNVALLCVKTKYKYSSSVFTDDFDVDEDDFENYRELCEISQNPFSNTEEAYKLGTPAGQFFGRV